MFFSQCLRSQKRFGYFKPKKSQQRSEYKKYTLKESEKRKEFYNPTKLFECPEVKIDCKMSRLLTEFANSRVQSYTLQKYVEDLLYDLLLLEICIMNNQKVLQLLLEAGPDHDKISDVLNNNFTMFEQMHKYEVCPKFIYNEKLNLLEFNKCIAQFLASHERKQFENIIHTMHGGKFIVSHFEQYFSYNTQLKHIKADFDESTSNFRDIISKPVVSIDNIHP